MMACPDFPLEVLIDIKESVINKSGVLGLFFVVAVSVGIFVSLETEAVSGCAGDCMMCHPQLENSEEHSALKTCIQCHNTAKPDRIKLFSEANGCGARCFECHSQFPQNAPHAALSTCINCHTDTGKKIMIDMKS